MNSGGIRGSIQIGNFTAHDVASVFPFKSSFDLIELRGGDLKAVFSNLADRLEPDTIVALGAFLQVSGRLVEFTVTWPNRH